MNNSTWETALRNALEEEYRSAAFQPMSKPFHIFSHAHEKKMSWICTETKSERFRLQIKQKVIGITASVLAACIGGTIAVSSDNSLISHFKYTYSDMLSTFEPLLSTSEESLSNVLYDKYTITCVLPGYELYAQYSDDYTNYVHYKDSTGKYEYHLFQFSKANKNIATNTEGAVLTEIEFGDDQEAIFWHTNQDYYALLWEVDDYVLIVQCNISKDALIQVAESVQKVESAK